MDHLAAPLEVLRARAIAWISEDSRGGNLAGRARAPRLLHVSIDAELVEGARALLAALEWAPDNCRPFFDLGAGAAWGDRAAELRALYAAHAAAYSRDGICLPELPAPPSGVGPLGVFAACVAAAARAFDDRRIGTRGIVVIVVIDAAAAGPARRELGELLAAPGLEGARWIWLDLSGSAAGDAVPCRIDRAAQRREVDELLAAMIETIRTTAGGGSAFTGVPGGARPRVAVPRHPGDPPVAACETDGAARARQIRSMLLAVQALRAGGPEAALPLVSQARDDAAAGGLAIEAAEAEILVGALAIAAALARGNSIRPAVAVFESAAARAEAAGAAGTCARARFFLGAAAASVTEVEIAGPALLAAADQARKAGDPVLSFHALRLAGELAMRVGLSARGTELWGEALRIADGMEAAVVAAMGLGPIVDGMRAAQDRR